MNDEPIRIGIAGLGRMGARHAQNFATKVRGVKLVVACSPLAEERAWAERTLRGVKTCTTFEELLTHPLDAVCIATPTSEHPRQIIAALEHGLHVFTEKPVSLNLEDGRRVEAAAAKFPALKVLVGLVRRFDASYRDAWTKVGHGLIGVPFWVNSHSLDKDDPSGFFVRFAATSGGIFADMTVHDVDLARWFLGNPRPVRAFASGIIAVHQGSQRTAISTTARQSSSSKATSSRRSAPRVPWRMAMSRPRKSWAPKAGFR